MTSNHNFDILVRLPVEIGQNIFSHLNGDDLWKILKVSKAWKVIANDEFLWKKQCLLDDLDINKEPSSGKLLLSQSYCVFTFDFRSKITYETLYYLINLFS